MATRAVWREKNVDLKCIQQQKNNNNNNYGNNSNTNKIIKIIIRPPPQKITTWNMVAYEGEYLGICGYQTKFTVTGVQRNNHWAVRPLNDR